MKTLLFLLLFCILLFLLLFCISLVFQLNQKKKIFFIFIFILYFFLLNFIFHFIVLDIFTINFNLIKIPIKEISFTFNCIFPNNLPVSDSNNCNNSILIFCLRQSLICLFRVATFF